MNIQRYPEISLASSQVLEAAERCMNHWLEIGEKSTTAMSPQDWKECMDIINDGVEKMESASIGCAPLQKMMVGFIYSLNALKEWREHGPFQESNLSE